MREPDATEERCLDQAVPAKTSYETPIGPEGRPGQVNPSPRSRNEEFPNGSGDRPAQVLANRSWRDARLMSAEPTAQLFVDLSRGFDMALGQSLASVQEFFLAVAGGVARLRVVGSDLADHLLRPWKHLMVPRSAHVTPALSIDVWDENATQVRCQVRDSAVSSQAKTAFSADGRFSAEQLSRTLSCLDRRTGRLLASVVWDDRVPPYEWAKPLCVPLLHWCEAQGVHTVHAGLTSHAGNGVLLPGMSGAGKSTAALGCVVGGHGFLADDLVGVQCLPGNTYLGHSLYGSLSIAKQHLRRFPEAARYAIPNPCPDDGKHLVALWGGFPHLLQRSVRVQAIAIPRITGRRESRVLPARKRDALIAVGVSSLLLIPQRDNRLLEILSGMVEQLPCFWLELGHDVGNIAARVEEIIEREAP